MRILFFVHTLGRTRHFRGVIAGLVERQHTVILATTGSTRKQHADPGDYDHARVEVVACPKERGDGWGEAAAWLRKGRDRLRYFDSRYANAERLADRAEANTPKTWSRALERFPWLKRHWRTLQRLLAGAEHLIPCDPGFLRFVRDQAPDVVLVTPLVEFGWYQTDYIKCAHRLAIPVAYLPFSWDNLTNRGLIRVLPDRVLVWNAHQQREAEELHGVPAARIVITGAPRFDEFFGMAPATTRRKFCKRLGLNPRRPLLLYLCSSGFVAPREVEFVRRWIGELRRAGDGHWLRDCQILIRPHPAYLGEWASADLSDLPGVAVWTRRSTMNGDTRLYDSLFHSAAVVGLNTSAMIEAAIVGRPVFTVAVPEFSGGQGGTIHFHYLLVENGGVVSMAASFEEHVQQLAAVRDQEPAVAERSRRFLNGFVRPRGLETPASSIMVEEIERVASCVKRAETTPFWHYPLRWALGAAAKKQLGRS